MLTTEEAFDKFRKRLELSETEERDAAKRHAEVRDCIRGGFDVKTDFLSGSYKRHTKTKPLKDVDVLFVLGEKEKWRRDKPPVEMLQAFEQSRHVQIGEIGKVQGGFISLETLPKDCFQVLVEGRRAANNNYMPATRLES